MALAEEAKRIAAQFDYPPDEVRKGVKEFIRQMDEGLEKQGTTLSQIPSYVTAVPNGTEKVGPHLLATRSWLTCCRVYTLRLTSVARTSVSVVSSFTETTPFP